jgi:DNA-directed RNA polymerase II subunit RPB1
MEDCKVYYDQTVRNATGAIVQYVYGEDGIDGIKIENQYLPYIGMNLIEMDIKYNLRPEEKLELFLTEDAMKQIASEPEWMNASREYYEQLLDDRQYLINDVFRGEKVDKIQYPIPFDRIIRNALQRLSQVAPTAVPTDLTPGYVLDALNKLLSKLRMLEKGQGVRFLHILLRLNLCPKVLIMEHHMSKTIFEWLVNEIELRFMKSLVHPGEMVGIIAAQSIGELSTQQTLDSFHSSGTAAAVKATSGVPRLKELLSVSKNIKTPSLLICLKPDIGQVSAPAEKEDGTVEDPRIQETKEKCIKVMQQLEITRMVDILDSTEIFWDPAGDRGLNTGITDDDGMLSVYRAFANIEENQCRSQSPWVLRMKINKDRLYRLGLTMIDIYIKLTTAYHQTIECVFSDDNATELIFRVRLTKEALKDVDPDDYISALKAMEHNIVTNILLKGLKGVKKVSMRSKNKQIYNAEKDKFEKVVEWMMDTDGTNLQDILANVNVDQIRTRSNDIYEIYQTLGIEAARNALYVEFMEVVGEGAINYRHMSLLLDTMTNRGTLMSVDRHGINRGDVGPLAKSSFEETTDMLINASMFSEHDRINGVSANIMLGQLPPCGTGDHEVLLDEDAFVELMKDKRKLSKKKEYMRFNEPVDDSTYAEKEACAIENIAFNYTLPERNKNIRAFPKQSVTFV